MKASAIRDIGLVYRTICRSIGWKVLLNRHLTSDDLLPRFVGMVCGDGSQWRGGGGAVEKRWRSGGEVIEKRWGGDG